jgi:hypothetical protein
MKRKSFPQADREKTPVLLCCAQNDPNTTSEPVKRTLNPHPDTKEDCRKTFILQQPILFL